MINQLLRALFILLIVRPLVLLAMGLNIRRRELLPVQGPAVIVANHNSHLDTLVILSLFPLKLLPKVRPVAAADYFLKNPLLAWFALNIIGIIPVQRATRGGNPLASSFDALQRGEILIIFPEGSRGNPEELTRFKKGVALISKKFPAVPISPLFLHGLGKALPRGEAVFVPFFCDAFVGAPRYWSGETESFIQDLEQQMSELATEGRFPVWE
ncbi:lysophospholipid acyltransferase family protein [Kiloniella laminariae]|uniref:lysophospholipid acyltransferase family protein n=1 Tax=Kiloniella laminariae TaxID=454162 RepID=UPI00037A4805|nr:lysophospholipid acyltransferase family protein [Kiloniella laminariae]